MKLKIKFLSVLMAGCVLASNVSAQTRSVLSLSESSKRYGITATGTWRIEYPSYCRSFQSELITTSAVSAISTGIYVYRMDNGNYVGRGFERFEDTDECTAKYDIPYNVLQTSLKANASFYAKNTDQTYAIMNIPETNLYVTEA